MDNKRLVFQTNAQKQNIIHVGYGATLGSSDPRDYKQLKQYMLDKTITIEAWIKSPYDSGTILCRSGSYEFGLHGQNGLYLTVYQEVIKNYTIPGAHSGPMPDAFFRPKFTTDVWHHVAVTWDGKAVVFYLDGNKEKEVPLEADPFPKQPGNVLIGTDSQGKCIAAKLAEVRVWNVVRSPEEIKHDMTHRLTGKEPGLVGYFPLDSDAQYPVDLTGYAAHGFVTNAYDKKDVWVFEDLKLEAPAPVGQSTSGTPGGSTQTGTGSGAGNGGSGDGEAIKAYLAKIEELTKMLTERDDKYAAYEKRIAELEEHAAEYKTGHGEQAGTSDELEQALKKCSGCEDKLTEQNKQIQTLIERLDWVTNEFSTHQLKSEEAQEELTRKLREHDAKCGDCAEKFDKLSKSIAELEQKLAGPLPKPAKKPDDLKLVEGIGPKIAELLHNAGITSFADLAKAEIVRLKEILGAAGKAFQTADPTTWPEQARLALEDRVDDLKALQDKLRAGRTS